MNNRIILTATPAGTLPDGGMKISVSILPDLGRAEYSNFSEDIYSSFWKWPETLRRINFSFSLFTDEMSSATYYDVVMADKYMSDPYWQCKTLWWEILFPKDFTIIGPRMFKLYPGTQILSFRMKPIIEDIIKRYSCIANNHALIPPRIGSQELQDTIDLHPKNLAECINDAIQQITNTPKKYSAEYERMNANGPSEPGIIKIKQQFVLGGCNERSVNYGMLKLSHETRQFGNSYDSTRERPKYKIHLQDILGYLRQYPPLMRMLGLIVDLNIDKDRFNDAKSKLGAGFTGRCWLSVRAVIPAGVSIQPTAHKSRVIYDRRTNLLFLSNDVQEEIIESRMLGLGTEAYGTMQIDIDSAAIKLSTYAAALSPIRGTVDPSSREAFPSLRSSGLSIFKDQRAVSVSQRMKRINEVNNKLINEPDSFDNSCMLYASDLIKGIRIDVWDDVTKKWHQLCRRKGTYRLVNNAADLVSGQYQKLADDLVATDEGWISSVGTFLSDTSNVLSLRETLFTWEGWSLCVPRPGKTIANNDTVIDMQDATELNIMTKDTIKTNLRVTMESEPGTLPRLRFGRTYLFRARTVDIAGYSVPFEDVERYGLMSMEDDDKYHTKAADGFYSRFQPVNPPILFADRILSSEISPGETTHRLIIRSNYSGEVNAASYRSNFFAQLLGDDEGTIECMRYIAPPRAGYMLVEQHGMYDARFDAILPTLASLANPWEDPDFKALYDDISNRDADGFEPYYTDRDPAAKANLSALCYLPDPCSRGALLRIYHSLKPTTGTPADSVLHMFYKDGSSGAIWPSPSILRLNLTDLGRATIRVLGRRVDVHYTDATAEARIILPKAAAWTVRLSSSLESGESGNADKYLNLFGIWRWSDKADPEGARLGKHWMITPFIDIEVIHAVQQPMTASNLKEDIESYRHIGDTRAYLYNRHESSASLPTLPIFKIDEVDGNSTGILEVIAEWDEPYDPVTKNIVIGERPITDDLLPHDGKKYGSPVWSIDMIKGTKKIFEYAIPAPGEPAATDTQPSRYNDKKKAVIIPYMEIKHEFGDTKHRYVRYKSRVISRFAEYFRPRVTGISVRLKGVNKRIILDINMKIIPFSEVVTDRPGTSEKVRQFVRDKDYMIDYIMGTITPIKGGNLTKPIEVSISFNMLPLVSCKDPTGQDLINFAASTAPNHQCTLDHGHLKYCNAIAEDSEIITDASGDTCFKREIDYRIDYPARTIEPIPGGGIEQYDVVTGAFKPPVSVRVKCSPLSVVRESAWSKVVNIKASARPAAPKVLYIVPTFKYEEPKKESATKTKSTRLGGGLRIYLDRPWYSSGEGEKLGVVLFPLTYEKVAENTGILNAKKLMGQWLRELEPYISQYGIDPVWKRDDAMKDTYCLLRSEHFKKNDNSLPITSRPDIPTRVEDELVRDITTSIPHAKCEDDNMEGGTSFITLDLVPYTPLFDKDRLLWYCDIQIKNSAYYPFVRLALARYQEDAIIKNKDSTNSEHPPQDLRISPIILADFIQLAPDRTATITFNGKRKFILTINGPIGKGHEGYNSFEIHLEKLDLNKLHAGLGWENVPFAHTPRLNSPQEGILWSGIYELPEDRSQSYRLIIEEYEIHSTQWNEKEAVTSKRLVYADIIPLG